jgi:predicted RNase H-like nuclease
MQRVSIPNDRSLFTAGADGCKVGWIRLVKRLDAVEITLQLFPTAKALIFARPEPTVLTLDAPIGLTEAGPRQCDQMARKVLGRGRASSVFPAPIRPALSASSQDEASELTQRIDGRRVPAQAWGIYPRIREIDSILRAEPGLQQRVREVHPEVCFWAWNGESPMKFKKKKPEGRDERCALINGHFGPGTVERVLDQRPTGVARDDIIDALAALWTAERIARGEARTLPPQPPVDEMGLRMEMVY